MGFEHQTWWHERCDTSNLPDVGAVFPPASDVARSPDRKRDRSHICWKNSHFHILLNGLLFKMTGIIFILFPMHSLGLAGIPRCYSDKLDSYST